MYSMDRPTLIIFAALATALLILFSGCVEQTGNLTNSLGKAKCKLNTYSNYMKGRHTGSYYDIAWSNKTTASACCKARDDCVALDGKCYSARKPYTGFDPKGNDNVAVCEWGAASGRGPRWWFDCDYSKTACGNCKLKWVKGGEKKAFGEYGTAP